MNSELRDVLVLVGLFALVWQFGSIASNVSKIRERLEDDTINDDMIEDIKDKLDDRMNDLEAILEKIEKHSSSQAAILVGIHSDQCILLTNIQEAVEALKED